MHYRLCYVMYGCRLVGACSVLVLTDIEVLESPSCTCHKPVKSTENAVNNLIFYVSTTKYGYEIKLESLPN